MARSLYVRRCCAWMRVQHIVFALLFFGILSPPIQAANPVQGQAYQYGFDPMSPNTAMRFGAWRRDLSSACQSLGDVLNAWFATFTDGRTRTLDSTLALGYYCQMNFTFSPACSTCSVEHPVLGGTLSTLPAEDHFHNNPQVCSPSGGNPIYPFKASKRQVEPLGFSLAPDVTLSVVFDSLSKIPTVGQEIPFAGQAIASFGGLWESSLHKSLALQRDSAGLRAIHASRGAGAWTSITYQSGIGYAPSADINDRIVAMAGGWRYYDAAASALETYDSQGQLNSVHYARGGSLSFGYSTGSTPTAPVAGLLISVQDSFGRSIGFEYEPGPQGQPPRVGRVTSSAGRAIDVGYDAAGNLQSLVWPDGETRLFLYDAPGLSWALSGIKDENGARHSTYGYDPQGRAVSTELAGAVSRFTASHSAPAVWRTTEAIAGGLMHWDHYLQPPSNPRLTDPLGQPIEFGTQLIQGTARMTSRSQAAGSGCLASSMGVSYDGNGNPASTDDFNGYRTCRQFNPTRNLEGVAVEGLPSMQACAAVLTPGAVLPAGSRKTMTLWHPHWRLRTQVAEPGRITTYVYNGQPDPTANGVTLSCAPASAALPDDKPIAVLCKQVEQATSDANGGLGFAAALDSSVPARVTRWTYNAAGQVLTRTDPLSNTTSYSYYTDTSFPSADADAVGHTKGDLQQVVTPAPSPGRPPLAVNYTLYNRSGQIFQMTDPNGVATTSLHDRRQRLTSTTTAGQTLGYEYWPTGLIKKVTQPDSSWLYYEHDDAHRLRYISDNLGNSVTYTLDNLGNHTTEDVKDPSNTLRRTLGRSIDALGRVQQVTGRE